MTSPSTVTIRQAVAEDLLDLESFIRELAREEGLPEVSALRSDLHGALFGDEAFAKALIAEAAGEAVGFALYYPKYATISGRRGFHLEDLYVAASHRGQGVGQQILDHLEDAAGPNGMVDWWVMHSNTAALRFYRRVGARALDGIAVYRRDHPEVTSESRRTGLSSAETVEEPLRR